MDRIGGWIERKKERRWKPDWRKACGKPLNLHNAGCLQKPQKVLDDGGDQLGMHTSAKIMSLFLVMQENKILEAFDCDVHVPFFFLLEKAHA